MSLICELSDRIATIAVSNRTRNLTELDCLKLLEEQLRKQDESAFDAYDRTRRHDLRKIWRRIRTMREMVAAAIAFTQEYPEEEFPLKIATG